MPQADGVNKLKRMQFEFKGKTYDFNINPEEYNQDETNRSTVTQTKSGAFVDDFGAGLPSIYMKGTTGFKNGEGEKKFKALRNFVRNYWSAQTPGKTIKDELVFHNFTDDESWVVHTDPSAFKLLRSKSNPLLYSYEIRLICLRKASEPKSKSKSGGVNKKVGTPKSVKSKSTDLKTAGGDHIKATLSIKNGTPISPLTAFTKVISVLPSNIVKQFGRAIASSLSLDLQYFGDATSAQNDIATTFEPVLSKLAADTLAQIQSDNFVSLLEKAPEGSLVEKFQNLKVGAVPNDILVGTRIVALELMSIATALSTQDDQYIVSNLSETDLLRTCRNIRWLTEQYGKSKTPDYDFINEMRWLERAVRYILTSSLFVIDVTAEMDKINEARS